MRGAMKRRRSRGLLAAMIASLLLGVPAWSASGGSLGSTAASPAASTRAAILPQVAVTIDLCAVAGSKTMPDATSVPIWGFAVDGLPGLPGCGTATAQLPGPVLDVVAGTPVTVNLENPPLDGLTENVSILFYGQDLTPDTTGAGDGLSVQYTFIADDPGTFLYQAGVNSTVQVPMGLYGAMVVRPLTAGQAYDDPDTAFDVERVLVLSEVDAELNNTADPNDFNMLEYKPEFWLINGLSYPAASLGSVTGGQKVLLRYVNAGLEHHSMTMLGLRADLVARDGYLANYAGDIVSETIAAGSTADAIVTAPSVAATTAFPVYNRQLHLDNAGTDQGGGGMLALLEVTP